MNFSFNGARSARAVIAALILAAPGALLATEVTMSTPFGDVQIDLLEGDAPNTVANFMSYVNARAYRHSIIHRVTPGFVVQGGGYRFNGHNIVQIPAGDPIANEANLSNVRGTLSMAKLSGDPDSATIEWFINLADNTNLDSSNGGYTVFGRVLGDGMDIIDQIAALETWNAGGALSELPLIDYPGSGLLEAEYLVLVDFPLEGDPDFWINAGLSDAWYDINMPGQGFFITVLPESGVVFLAWFTFDAERPEESITAILGEPGHRWFTAQGVIDKDRAVMDITSSEGGVFDMALPLPANRTAGTLTLIFTGCNSATLSYEFPDEGLSRTMDIQRVVPDNVGLCEDLVFQ